MGFIGGVIDKIDDTLDFVGDNLQANQDYQRAIIDRERARTMSEMNNSKQNAELRNKQYDLLKTSILFMGIVLVVIVFSQFMLPKIINSLK